MMTTLHRLRIAAVTAVVALATVACGGDQGDTATSAKELKIVAASTWEAGFAKAAGATDVTVIVPPGVQHAADYDPKPSDLAKVAEADIVLYAEFEGFAAKIKEAAGSSAKLIPLTLDNNPATVKSQVDRLGSEFGTRQATASWIDTFDSQYAALKKEVRAAAGDTPPVIVSQAFVTWAADLVGAIPAGTFGPQPPTASQISELIAKKPQLILDNSAMPGGDALAGVGGKRVVIDNFPGEDLDLLEMFERNARTLITALS